MARAPALSSNKSARNARQIPDSVATRKAVASVVPNSITLAGDSSFVIRILRGKKEARAISIGSG